MPRPARAQLFLFDEPAVGLSPTERTELAAELRRLADQGFGIVLVAHQQELVMAVSDRVLVLNHGRKIAEAHPEQIRQDDAVLEACLGYD
jgi:branched-chain amino acid transport system ATP-binding protein